jgi:hypothetical protein
MVTGRVYLDSSDDMLKKLSHSYGLSICGNIIKLKI